MEAIVEVDEVLKLRVEGRESHDEKCMVINVGGEGGGSSESAGRRLGGENEGVGV